MTLFSENATIMSTGSFKISCIQVAHEFFYASAAQANAQAARERIDLAFATSVYERKGETVEA
jgi:hypothetical protein